MKEMWKEYNFHGTFPLVSYCPLTTVLPSGVLNGEAVAVKVLKMPQPGSNQSKEESRDLLAAFYEFRREVSIMRCDDVIMTNTLT